jgi:hypothetical protein
MYCAQCLSEYRDGIVRCSDCDVALVHELSEEPEHRQSNASGRGRSPELVADLLDRLEKAGVPYVIEAGTALAMLGNAEIVLDGPDPWEARVWIPQRFGEQAAGILGEVDEQYGRKRRGIGRIFDRDPFA